MKRIRVSAINGVAKKAALGAMLFSSVVMFATTPNRNTRTENPPQAEVVSREGADALKAITFPGFQQNTTVPTVHNKKLDENFLKFCNTSEEKRMINEFINNIYNEYGTYLGSANVQMNIDYNMFLEFLNGNIEILKKFDENAYNKIDKEAMKQVKEKSGPIIEWLNANYFSNVYKQPLGQFDHMPTAEEVNTALDKYVNEDPYNLFDNKKVEGDYKFANNLIDNSLKQTGLSQVLKDSYSVAHRVFSADYVLFFTLLKTYGVDIVPGNSINRNLTNTIFSVDPVHDML